jgi:ferredoxin
MSKVKVSFKFPANRISKPLTYHLIKDYDLIINILHADISLDKIGKLIVDIEGKEENIKKGLKFLKDEDIEYKIFTKKIIWKENECVHCGACTAVCPSGALEMDKVSWSLDFNKEKCLLCGLCVKACPLKVMAINDIE